MPDIAIAASALSKRYAIGARKARYLTLRDAMADVLARPIRRLRGRASPLATSRHPEAFWALKDVSFEIARGDVVGVVGRNGAGKSTLLKILSRITEPTSGYAEIRGRVASLLEVGTGFHLELTGRENVYLNGAILGMSRLEIDRKLDQIVEFAEVDTFLDTPVKHYSSGMQLRLAFSVAAHLEPEILLVDEVLAVGDAAFQKKCLGQVERVARQGRTVLFVSHNLGVVRELCERAMVLAGGRLVFDGGVVDGLRRYADSLEPATASAAEPADRGWHVVAVNERAPQASIPLTPTQPLTIDAWLDLRDRLVDVSLFCLITDHVGDLVVHQRVDRGDWPGDPTPGRHDVRVELPPLWLAPGLYTLSFKLIGRTEDSRDERLLSPPVLLDVTGADGRVGRARLAPPLRWTIRRSEPARDQEARAHVG